MPDIGHAVLLLGLLAAAGAAVAVWRRGRVWRERAQAVQARHDALYGLVDAGQAAILLTDVDGRIAWVNAAYESLSGYSLAALREMPADLLLRDVARTTAADVRRRLLRGEIADVQLEQQASDGRAYRVHARLVPSSGTESSLHYAAMLVDITDYAAQAVRLRESNETLARRLGQRTRELLAARESATAAYRTKAAWQTRIATKLHQPLHAVLAYCGLALERAQQDARQRRYLLDLQQAAAVAVSHVEAVRGLTDSQLGQASLNLREIALDQLVETVLSTWRIDAPALIGRVVLEGEGPSPTIVADAERLSRVVRHLVANALRYSADDTPVNVIVGVETNAHGDTYARLAVTDAGIGLPPGGLDALVEHGPDASPDLIRAGITGGIGLTTCRQVAMLHGGRLTAQNNSERGSTFVLSLPLLRESDRQPVPA